MTNIQRVALWKFPPCDFDAWREFCTDIQHHETYEDYIDDIETMAEVAENNGIQVVILKMTVEDMKHGLKETGLENTSQNRAGVLAIASGLADL